VKADWIRFTPTKAVSNRNHSLTQWASARLIKTIVPASTRTALSIVIVRAFLLSVASKLPKLFFNRANLNVAYMSI